MIKLKNIILFTAICICSMVPVFSEDMGQVITYSEQIMPKENDDAVLYITVEGVTNEKGSLYVPLYKNADPLSLDIVKGSLNADTGKETSVYGKKCIEYIFNEKNAPVTIKQQYLLKDFYKGKTAKIKDSHPGGISTISYKFNNNIPVGIGSYSVSLSIPKGVELYEVLSPAKSKDYTISMKEGIKTVSVENKKIGSAGSYTVSVNIYRQPVTVKIVIWITAIALSIFLLYKRKDIIKVENK